MIGCNGGFIRPSFGNFDFPIPAVSVQSRKYRRKVQRIDTFVHAGIGYENRTVTALNLQWSAQKGRVPSILGTKAICEDHSEFACLITFMASIRSVSYFSNSVALDPARFGAE